MDVVAAHIQWQALVVLTFCSPRKVNIVKVNGYELDSQNSFLLKEFKKVYIRYHIDNGRGGRAHPAFYAVVLEFFPGDKATPMVPIYLHVLHLNIGKALLQYTSLINSYC